MKVIIIGNGFDLHHKYKTSFYDFRTHLKSSKSKQDQILISKIDELLEVTDNEQKSHLLWNDFESIIGNLMRNQEYKKHKVKNIPFLVEKFTQNFYEYLITISNTKELKINKKIEEEFKDASTVLTFNYTSFYSSYSLNGNVDIFHIHGNLTENDLPIIGFYYQNAMKRTNSLDYSVKYGGKLIHKAALSLKQNEIDLDERIRKYTERWQNKITEIVILGYSFGSSDNHIYKIIDDIMINQSKEINVPSSRAEKIKLIKFIIYSYDDNESNLLIERIKSYILKFGRKFSINVTGLGFVSEERDILTFELKKY
jgi:hypothetical protein